MKPSLPVWVGLLLLLLVSSFIATLSYVDDLRAEYPNPNHPAKEKKHPDRLKELMEMKVDAEGIIAVFPSRIKTLPRMIHLAPTLGHGATYFISTADEAPKTSLRGQLNYAAQRKAYSLSCTATVNIAGKDTAVSYDVPLTLAEAVESESVSALVGRTVTASGYMFGEPRSLFVVELTQGTESARSTPAPQKKNETKGPKKDTYGDEK